MSQVSIIDIEGNNPQIPTRFNANVGFAIPIANTLEILGQVVTAGVNPVRTIGSGNTITTQVQVSQAIAAPDLTKVGLSVFDSQFFTVDATGFVSIAGGVLAETLTGNVGGPISPAAGNWNIITAGTTAKFTGGGSTLTLDFGITNLLIGTNGSITTGGANVSIGDAALQATTVGGSNFAGGQSALAANTTGTGNTAIGNGALMDFNPGGAVSIQTFNTALGNNSLNNLLTGVRNLALGGNAGFSYTSSESSNIVLRNTGTVGESNTIRIGTQGSGVGQQNRAFMAGITGVTVAASSPVAVDANGQLSDLGFGTSTQVLTSNGPGVSPTWQATLSTVGTITGNTGGAQGQTANNWNLVTANSTPIFAGASSTFTLDFGLTNLALGSSLPSLNVGTTNVSYGLQAMAALTNGSGNSIVGYQAAMALTTGSNNCAFGKQSLINLTGSVQNTAIGVSSMQMLGASVGHNTAVGYGSLIALTTGDSNTVLGISAGSLYTGSESSNICVGSNGIAGDNNTIRIGAPGSGSGQQNRAFMAGITAVTVSASAPVGVDTNGQLSSLGFGTAGQLFVSAGAGVSPAWTTPAGYINSWEFDTAVTSVAVVPNKGYVAMNSGVNITYTLPTSGCPAGSVNRFVCNQATGDWLVAQSTGQQILWGALSSTIGATGFMNANSIGDCITLLCVVANTTWMVIQTEGNPAIT